MGMLRKSVEKGIPMTVASTSNGNSAAANGNGHQHTGRYSAMNVSPSKYRRNGSGSRIRFFLCAASFGLLAAVYLYFDAKFYDRIIHSLPGSVGTPGDTGDIHPSAHRWGHGLRPGSVKSISVLGERNSGTTWVYEHLGECFNHTIPVRRRLTRYKHWFQHETERKDRQYDGSLVLAQFRNIFDWTRAMQATPHHAPDHLDIKDWKEFVTKKWTMKRFGKDLNMTEDEKSGEAGPVCQEDFFYRDIISCQTRPYPDDYWENRKHRYSEHQPFYEMRNDGSGEPYDNVLDMRAAKIENFLETKKFPWVEDVWVIRYESLLKEGTAHLIEVIERATGIRSTCKASPPQNRKKRDINPGLKKWLLDEEHVDWGLEKKIGYTKDH